MLVLSLFPGGGVLDFAFECEGFCVVRAPDVLWGGNIESFHPPAGRFEGIIGGDPCQSHSALANLVRARGFEPSFPDLGPEYERCVNEARPAWFLRENVPAAPDIKPDGYDVRSFMLDNSTLDSGDGWGNEQMRRRRFWFGVRDGAAPELRQWMRFALHELPAAAQAATVQGGHDLAPGQRDKYKRQVVAADHRAVPVAIGGSGKVKVTAVDTAGRSGHRVNDDTGGTVEGNFRARRKVTADGGHDGTADSIQGYRNARKAASVTGRHEGRVGSPEVDYSPPRRTLEEMLRLQGMPLDWFKHSPFTVQGKRKIIGNAVSVPMGRELARAIRRAMAAVQPLCPENPHDTVK